MPELEVTRSRALKIWWSLFWRSMMIFSVLGFAALWAVISGGEGHVTITGPSVFLFLLTAFVVFVLISVVIMKSVLRKTFSDFVIVLIPKDEACPPAGERS